MVNIRYLRIRKYRSQCRKIWLVAQLVAIWYIAIFTTSYLTSQTTAYFNDQETDSFALKAGTWETETDLEDDINGDQVNVCPEGEQSEENINLEDQAKNETTIFNCEEIVEVIDEEKDQESNSEQNPEELEESSTPVPEDKPKEDIPPENENDQPEEQPSDTAVPVEEEEEAVPSEQVESQEIVEPVQIQETNTSSSTDNVEEEEGR